MAFAAIGHRLSQDCPARGARLTAAAADSPLVPGHTADVRLRGCRRAATLLMAAVASVLLIACSNLAGFPWRAARQAQDRDPPGAGCRALAGHQAALTETLLVAAVERRRGPVVAVWTKDLLRAFTPDVGVPLAIDLSLDYRVLAFSLVAVLVATVASVCRRRCTPPDPPATTRCAKPRRRTRRAAARHACATGCLSASRRVAGVGDVRRDVPSAVSRSCTPSTSGSTRRISPCCRSTWAPRAIRTRGRARSSTPPGARVERLPGVESVRAGGLCADGPQSRPPGAARAGRPAGWSRSRRRVCGLQPRRWELLETMRIPLLAGRTFQPGDADGRAPSVIVNDAFGEWFWKGDDPIGKVIVDAGGASRAGGRRREPATTTASASGASRSSTIPSARRLERK